MVQTLGVAREATAILGCDTASVVSIDAARSLKAQGFGFCARFLQRSVSIGGSGSLTIAEAQGLLAAGLAIVPVQFGKSSLVPTAALGTEVGGAAAANAKALGIPAGVTVWCDLEWGAHVHPDPDTTIAYANAWWRAVLDAGFGAGLYVGPNVPLDGVQLGDLGFTAYWKSASCVHWPTPRGFQLMQGLTIEVAGLRVDPDVACFDANGDRTVWLAAAEASA